MDTRPPLSNKAFLDAILGRSDPAKTAAFVAAITGDDNPNEPGDKDGKPIRRLTREEFVRAITCDDNGPPGMSTAEFVAAITGEGDYYPRESPDQNGRPAKSLAYTEWINTVKYGNPHPLTAAEFVAAITGESGFIPREFPSERAKPAGFPAREDALSSDDPFVPARLGEAGFDPNEPRDERGRWTNDGSHAGLAHTVSYGDPGSSPDRPAPAAGPPKREGVKVTTKEDIVVKGEFDTIHGQLPKPPGHVGAIDDHWSVQVDGHAHGKDEVVTNKDGSKTNGFSYEFKGRFPAGYGPVTMHLPTWKERVNATDAEKKAWDEYVDRVRKHEQGHIDVGKQVVDDWNKGPGAKEFSKKFVARTQPEAYNAMTEWLGQMAKTAKGDIGRNLNDANAAYHKKVGTTIPPPEIP